MSKASENLSRRKTCSDSFLGRVKLKILSTSGAVVVVLGAWVVVVVGACVVVVVVVVVFFKIINLNLKYNKKSFKQANLINI